MAERKSIYIVTASEIREELGLPASSAIPIPPEYRSNTLPICPLPYTTDNPIVNLIDECRISGRGETLTNDRNHLLQESSGKDNIARVSLIAGKQFVAVFTADSRPLVVEMLPENVYFIGFTKHGEFNMTAAIMPNPEGGSGTESKAPVQPRDYSFV